MRDIIFRGKRTDGRGWAYGAYVECRLSWYRRHPHRAWIITDARSNGGWFAVGSRYPVVNDSVGQYTGLKDKACRMIFEGDILSAHLDERYPENETRSVVLWDENTLAWGMKESRCDMIDSIEKGDSEYWTVIGNIHDNPELMEVEA